MKENKQYILKSNIKNHHSCENKSSEDETDESDIESMWKAL